MAEYTFKTREPIPETTDKLHERIRELNVIKDELDTELALLLGHKPKFDTGTPWHCVRCDHSWISRLPHKPRLCPRCKTYKFDIPPAYTYEERVNRRKPLRGKLMAAQVAPLPHSVLTREMNPPITRAILPPEDDIQSIALAPPPVPINMEGLSLREKLALLNQTKSEDELVQAINGESDAT